MTHGRQLHAFYLMLLGGMKKIIASGKINSVNFSPLTTKSEMCILTHPNQFGPLSLSQLQAIPR